MADIVSEPAPLARPRPEPQVGRNRFGVAYLALAAIVGTAVGLTVIFATRDSDHKTAVAWSDWQPKTTGTLGVREIARHVAPQYVLPGGRQLASVIAGPMELQSAQGPIPVSAILISSGTSGVRSERIDVSYPQAGVFYQLCGSADANCIIPGASTPSRGQLVLREGIELALYTFHYLPNSRDVVVFLPPPRGVQEQDPRFHRALYLPRRALATELAAPLTANLPSKSTKITPSSLPAGQSNEIAGLTAGRVLHYDFQQSAGNSAYLLLSPIEP
jgi:hypothetical protein